jgi:UDP-N-acetylmuramoyl-L-alanyl-D-glutamate--2,6-diaminopimelate ligase
VIVTSDNPRTEDPERIFADIRAGFARLERAAFIPDRATAVAEAVMESSSPERDTRITRSSERNGSIWTTANW